MVPVICNLFFIRVSLHSDYGVSSNGSLWRDYPGANRRLMFLWSCWDGRDGLRSSSCADWDGVHICGWNASR